LAALGVLKELVRILWSLSPLQDNINKAVKVAIGCELNQLVSRRLQ